MSSASSDTTAPQPRLNTPASVCTRRTLLQGIVGVLGASAALRASPATAPQVPAAPPSRDVATGALFDGTALGAWTPVNFGGEGQVHVEDGAIILERGNDLTGIRWTGAPLPSRYLLEVEAMRVDGSDFFCALTFPIADTHCSFVVGGWGGSLIGFSSIDGYDAGENETAQVRRLEDKRWYRIGVEVTPERMRGRLDDEWLAEVETEGRDIDVRIEMLPCRPLGVASYRTIAAIRAIRVTPLPDA